MSTVVEYVTPRVRRVERISPADLVQLTTDVGPVPMYVGAVLLLAPGGPRAASVLDVLAARLSGVARLRQRLATPPWGLGRPCWIEDESFDLDDHLSEVDCPGHGDLDSLLGLAVPVSARTSTTSGELGNEVGVMPVHSRVEGAVRDRLTEVVRATGRQKGRTRGASAALVGPVFRVLAAVGLFRWFVDRQRLVNSFLTNLRGLAEPMSFAGMTVQRLLPITITAGNVGVAFAALSYAGRLSVTVITDPDLVPESGLVVAALAEELAAVARA